MSNLLNPHRILIFSGGEIIGDGLMKLPYIYALREAYPKAHITWLSGRGKTVYTTILNPLVKSVLDEIMEDQGIGWRFREALKNPLPGKQYDLIIDTQKWACVPLTLKRIPHRLLLSHAWKGIFSSSKSILFETPPRHDIKRLFHLTSYAGVSLSFPQYRPQVPEEHKCLIQTLLPQDKILIGLAPGAGNMAKGETKCWPLEKYIKLAQNQLEKGRTPVFILGPAEQEWVSVLKEKVPQALFPLQQPHALSSPLFTISLVQSLKAAVSNDSGAGHMCAVAGIPLVSLFGPTNPQKMAPLTKQGKIIVAQDYGSSRMSNIPLLVVEQALDQLLSSWGENS